MHSRPATWSRGFARARTTLLALALTVPAVAAVPGEFLDPLHLVPAVDFDTAAQSAGEGAGTVTVGVTLSETSALDVTIPYTLSGTAVDPDDYGVDASPLVILAGATTGSITVTLVDDSLDEADETVVLTLGTPTNGVLGSTTEHTLTITDDDAPPSVTFDLASQSAGEETGSATIGLTLSAASGQDVTVPFTVTGSAVEPDDYGIDASPLVILAGATTASVSVTLVDDSLDEADETVVVTLGTPTNATLGAITDHTLTITDDDAPPSVTFDLASQSAGEETGTATIGLTLSAASGQDVTVPFTVTGSAVEPDDYGIDASPVVILAGATTASVSVTLVDDSLDEADETVVVTLGTPTNATLGAITDHTLTITDDDAPPSVTFDLASQSAGEETGTATIGLTLSAASGQDVTVPFTVTGSAVEPDDYGIDASPLVILAGATTANVSVTLVDDSLDEADETVVVTLGTPTNATLGAITDHTLTITDDDDPPSVTFDLASQSAGEETGTATIGLTLSAASGQDVTVPFTVTGSAVEPDDYGIDASPLVILAGATTASVSVTLVDDSLDEADETVVVTLGAPTNATLGAITDHTLTITDDDDPPSVTFDLASQSAGEGSGTATITLTLSAASSLDVTVPFTVGGDAIDPDDYGIDASPLMILAGDTTASIVVTLVDDGLDELDETVVVTLGSPTNATLGAITEHTLTINDNDGPSVTFDFSGQVSDESDGAASIGLTLSEVTSQDVTIPFTVSGSAVDPDDYGIDASPIVILAGDTTADISMTLVDDLLDEQDETVVITLGTPTNADLGAITKHTVTITDDDGPPSITFDLANQSSAEGDGGATIGLTLSVASGKDVTIPFAVSGSAVDPDDYGIDGSPVVIPAGDTTAILSVALVDDSLDEPDETVVVTLGTPTNATLGAIGEHTLTITDDDAPPSITFDLAGQSTGEGDGIAAIDLTLSEVSGQDVTVPFTVGGSAVDPDDFGIDASPILIAAGDTTASISLIPVDDLLDEEDETVVVTLGSPTNATLGAITEHTVVLLDDDPLPVVEFALADGSAPEGDGAVAVEVSLSTVSGRDVTVPFTVSGTALDPDDYGVDVSPLVVPAGDPSASITILVLDDTTYEPDETVIIDLGTPVNADLGPLDSHVHTIVDDDDPPTIRFNTQGQEQHEDEASGTVFVQLSQFSGFEVVVTVALSGSATLGEDYTFGDLTVTIPPGEKLGAYSFASIPDSVIEGDETIVVSFDQVQGATIGIPIPHTVTLHEDDLFVQFALASSTANEEEGTVDVAVSLSEAWTSDIVVGVATGGDATLGVDYQLVEETTTILAGETSGVLQVALLDDLVPEFTEEVVLTLLEPANATTGDPSDHTLFVLDTDTERIFINEFLALNDGWIEDEDGSDSDWIEIHSSFLTPVDLDGYYLTDDVAFPTKWQFPSTPLAAGGYLVVFASAKDRAVAGQELHTNFELSSGGEYLALVASDGTTIVSEYSPAFPEQFTNVSYGLDPVTLTPEYFAPPTPGALNGEPGLPLPPVLASLDRGLYDSPQTLIFSHPTSGATIRYTTDGSVPTETTGTAYSAPLSITGTTCVRASAFLEGFAPSPPVTRTYIFPAEVPSQSDASAIARGFPADWVTKDGENWTEGKSGGRPGAWYGFDAQVLQNYSGVQLEQMLSDLPTVSLVMSIDDWFGADPNGTLGIYSNSEEEDGVWERPGSIEWIDGAGGPEFGIDCLFKIQGNGSTRPETRNQLSIATKFQRAVGPSKLVFPLFDDSDVDRFDYLVFDAGNQYSINEAAQSDAGYIKKRHAQGLRDQFAMELFGAAGHPTQHGRFVHLYLNGLYWGVYNLHERADHRYGAEYFGGEDEEYDYLKGGIIERGNSNPWDDPTAPGAWPTVIAIAQNGVGPNDVWQGAPGFEALDDLIDLEGYIDYVLINFWLANRDWPESNHIQHARARLGPGLDDVNPDLEFKFFTWDTENVMPNNADAMLIGDGIHDRSDLTSTALQNVLFLHTALLENPEYLTLLADRAWRLMREGGALYVDPDYSGIGTPFDPEHPERNRPAALYYANSIEVSDVIDLEYARWGDYWPLATKITIEDWRDERQRILNDFCAFRTTVFLEQLRTGLVLYPSIDPPLFSQNGGCVDAGFTLELLPQQAGDVYYTLDGTDPRAPGGGISGAALLFAGPFSLPDTITRVRARSSSGAGEWSAVNDYTFAVDAKVIRINEFLAENQHGIVDEVGEREDWIELYNTNDEAIDLTDWTLSDDPLVPGKWTFPAGTVIGPKGYLLIWADNEPADGPLHATFRLKKGGETIGLYLPEELESVAVDSVLFGPQVPDVSSGRTPNGSGPFKPYPNPTPGAPNLHRGRTPGLAPGGG